MLIDPVTVAASAPTPELKLSIIKQDGYGSERADGAYRLITQHTRGKAGNRHYLQLLLTKDATDPYTGLVRSTTAYVSFTISRPPYGWTDAEISALSKALTDYRDDSEVTTVKLLNFQA